jgi:O-antigen/teichoic acid export membrane protein
VNPLKKLAGQTAVYGLSTIVGRLLNYLLVPLYTYQFADPRDYGVVTEFYAYLSFLNIVLLYGMETALFNFSAKRDDTETVFGTAQASILVTSLGFLAAGLYGSEPLAVLLRHPEHADYVRWTVWVLALDALAAIPFARLRLQQRAGRFAALKLANIGVNIAVNLLFIGAAKWAYDHPHDSEWPELAGWYDPAIGVGYVFIANLAASAVTLLLLVPQLFERNARIDLVLWRNMLGYGLPLLIAGLAGMVNETLDRVLLKYLLPPDQGLLQLGIYGACYKVAVLMSIFIQAYRYAAEPFFFALYRQKEGRELYALTMNGFVIACSAIFLGVMVNLGWIQYFVGAAYREGLGVVPILLLANLCLGVFFNLSIWYKLTEQTRYGSYLTLWGAALTLGLNWYWIPRIGYWGSAWATLICYASMAVLSYAIGQRHFPVAYRLKRLLGYPSMAAALAGLAMSIQELPFWADLAVRNTLLVVFLAGVWTVERLARRRGSLTAGEGKRIS